MHVWTEGEGKKGSNEICSCMQNYFDSIDLQNFDNVKSFSNACGGQNRNRNIIEFFMYYHGKEFCHILVRR